MPRQEYVKTLNAGEGFAGYTGWRLPTIPELVSLLEPEEQSNGLYLSPIFDNPGDYSWYWSTDKRQIKGKGSSESAWLVNFPNGGVYRGTLVIVNYVRGVRSRQ